MPERVGKAFGVPVPVATARAAEADRVQGTRHGGRPGGANAPMRPPRGEISSTH